MNGGLYVLLLQLEESRSIRVGALGRIELDAGSWIYVGSARRGLRARVTRHFARNKPVRWHIDYLTTRRGVRVVGAALVFGHELRECDLNRDVARQLGGQSPVPRFGASDCRSSCPAHLWRLPSGSTLQELASALPREHVYAVCRGRNGHLSNVAL